jgi:hypothetical protein
MSEVGGAAFDACCLEYLAVQLVEIAGSNLLESSTRSRKVFLEVA